MFEEFIDNPKPGAVYNAGGGRESNCSLREAVRMCEELTGERMNLTYSTENRIGDHIWYISNLGRFKQDYPRWKCTYTMPEILGEIYERNFERWAQH
jgi:CDP-paratose 2-epimerase